MQFVCFVVIVVIVVVEFYMFNLLLFQGESSRDFSHSVMFFHTLRIELKYISSSVWANACTVLNKINVDFYFLVLHARSLEVITVLPLACHRRYNWLMGLPSWHVVQTLDISNKELSKTLKFSRKE